MIMNKFFKQHLNLLIVVGIILFSIVGFFLYPKFLDAIYFIHNREYEPGIYEYYDVAVEYMNTSEEMKGKYGEDFTFYLMSMEYTRNHINNEGEAEVTFWIKGRRHETVYLEWQNNEWIVVDLPKKWRD